MATTLVMKIKFDSSGNVYNYLDPDEQGVLDKGNAFILNGQVDLAKDLDKIDPRIRNKFSIHKMIYSSSLKDNIFIWTGDFNYSGAVNDDPKISVDEKLGMRFFDQFSKCELFEYTISRVVVKKGLIWSRTPSGAELVKQQMCVVEDGIEDVNIGIDQRLAAPAQVLSDKEGLLESGMPRALAERTMEALVAIQSSTWSKEKKDGELKLAGTQTGSHLVKMRFGGNGQIYFFGGPDSMGTLDKGRMLSLNREVNMLTDRTRIDPRLLQKMSIQSMIYSTRLDGGILEIEGASDMRLKGLIPATAQMTERYKIQFSPDFSTCTVLDVRTHVDVTADILIASAERKTEHRLTNSLRCVIN